MHTTAFFKLKRCLKQWALLDVGSCCYCTALRGMQSNALLTPALTHVYDLKQINIALGYFFYYAPPLLGSTTLLSSRTVGRGTLSLASYPALVLCALFKVCAQVLVLL